MALPDLRILSSARSGGTHACEACWCECSALGFECGAMSWSWW